MLRSFDDLDTPLHQVTFCVVDLETTGASPRDCAITEVGAAVFRGGERLGTFQTLVDPGVPISPAAAALTGITRTMVEAAPPASAVLPSLAEFVGGSVLVGHNLRFDLAFLDAALTATDRSPVALHTVDTVALARCLVRGDVDDCRLATLAHQLGLEHRPTHRALDDAIATADLLHALLERAASFGVTVLDDLLELPRIARHPQAAKLGLTNRLPRTPGAYVLRDGQGRALLVGGAGDDLRRHVRSLFSGDHQRDAGPALRAMHAVDHVPCPTALDAAVAEVRLVHALRPRHADRSPGGRAYRYVKLGGGRAARLTVTRTAGPTGGAHYLGPLPTAGAARGVVDAAAAAGALASAAAGGAAVDGTGTGPATASAGRAASVAVDLFDRPARVVHALHDHARAAHAAGRYAQAAALQAHAAAVTDAVARQRRFDALRRAGHVTLELPDGAGVELHRGRLVRTWAGSGSTERPGPTSTTAASRPDGPARGGPTAAGPLDRILGGPVEPPPSDGPLPADMADELTCVADWLDRNAHRLRPLHVGGELSSPLPPLPSPAAPGLAPALRPTVTSRTIGAPPGSGP